MSRMVRKGGFEPPRYCYRQPLKLVRLPVPPLPRVDFSSEDSAATLAAPARALEPRAASRSLEPESSFPVLVPVRAWSRLMPEPAWSALA